MNKRVKVYVAVWVILFAIFNAVCFVTPSDIVASDCMIYDKFGGSFWLGYAGIAIAFIGNLICGCYALSSENKTKVFYNIPVIRVNYTGLILNLIFGSVVMIVPDFPMWVAVLVLILILGFNAIAVIKAAAAADIVEGIDEKISNKTMFIKMLTADAQELTSRAATDELKEECRKIEEKVRYSDPMSNIALVDTEDQITAAFRTFSEAVLEGDLELSRTEAENLSVLIDNRNRKCKLLK